MNWSDEHYVKVYTRETPNWSMLPWQSRALFLLVLKKADKAGLIDLGKDHVRALSAYLAAPIDFVEPGLTGLLNSGTCELRDGVLITPKFLDAQEARKTKVAASREFRDRARAEARAGKRLKSIKPTESRRNGSNDVGTLQPSPTPTPAQPEKTAGKKPPAPPKPERPPDPRHAPLVAELVEVFAENTGGARYPFDGRAAKAVTELLAIEPVPERISTVWRLALRRPGFPTVRTLPELVTHWAHFVGTGPPPLSSKGPVDAATQVHTHTGYVENF